MSGIKVSRIPVHRNPHLDELFGLWLLRNHGQEKFLGVKNVPIVIWGKAEVLANPPDVALATGSLCVGIGGGMFDEHGRNGHKREDCATTLIAKYLGLMDDPVIGFLAKGLFEADAHNADGRMKTLAEKVKEYNRYWAGSIDLEGLYRRVEVDIQVEIARRKERLEAKALWESRMRKTIAGVRIAGGVFDNVEYQHVARKNGAQLIIQRNSDGLTQILSLNGKDLDMPELTRQVRLAEVKASRLKSSRLVSDEELRGQGTVPEIPHWHLDRNNLLNGSESYTDTPPSRIDIRELFQIVEKHLTELRPKGEKEKESEIRILHGVKDILDQVADAKVAVAQ